MMPIKQIVLFVILLSLLSSCTPALTRTPTPVPANVTDVAPASTALNPSAPLTPEVPRILWDKTYSKTANDMGEDVLAADDGGFYIVGTANQDVSGSGVSGDIYLIRTDANGEVLWEKTYGGDKSEEGLSLTRTKDGNLLLAGMTKSSGAGGADAYLAKVDLDGNEIWSKAFGGLLDESASARELADGGIMLWGNSVNPNDIVADPGAAGYGGYEGRSNIFLAKIDAAGNQIWSQTFGGKNNLLTSGGVEASDGGFVVLASFLRFPEPGDDIYLLKLDKNGNKVWDRTWEDGTTTAYDLIRTADDNYLIAASVTPADDITRSKADFLFVKVDQQGKDLWTSTFGDPTMLDYPMAVAQTADGGYITAGDWIKDLSGASVGLISITKIGPDGKLVWEKTIKPAGRHNVLRTWLQLADGSCLLVGSRLTQQFSIYLMKVDVGVSSAYLGQTPPGLTPQVFAPNIVSIPGAIDYAGSFSPDGQEFYFTRRIDKSNSQNIFETHLSNGIWSEPTPVSFSADNANEPHVTFDNKTLYFGRVLNAQENAIWATDRTVDGWSEPRYVGTGMFVSSDQNGQVYVTDLNTRSLNKAIVSDGIFTKLEYISAGIHPAIAPDGSYLVYDDGDGNLRVRFRLSDEKWGPSQDLTKQGIPTSASIATISPDGKYLFYTEQGDLYWVSTDLIENLRNQ